MRPVILIFILAAAGLGAQPTSILQCGADPTGIQDSTKAFAACLRPDITGKIAVPPGHYKISGTIVKTRSQNLIGSGTRATLIQCQSRTTPCIVVADIVGGPNNYADSRIEDLSIEGPGAETASIGLFLGGDPKGQVSPAKAFADGANLINVRIHGFGQGIVWGNNAWGNKLVRTLVFGNSTGLYVPSGTSNSGENVGLTDSGIFNNKNFGLDDHGNFEWMMNGASFDYNGTAIQIFGATIHAVNCHFEQGSAQIISQPYGTAAISIRDSEILIQSSTGTDKYLLSLWPQFLTLALDDVSIWSNHPVQYLMHLGGRVSGTVNLLHGNGNQKIHAFAEGSTPGVVIQSDSAFTH